MPYRWIPGSLLAVALIAPPAQAQAPSSDYRAEVEAWRQRREQRLRADDGWLAVVGLFWLRQGQNTVGSAPDSAVLLPAPVPADAGTITLADGHATLVVTPGTEARVDGRPVTRLVLVPDTVPGHKEVQLGSVSLNLIDRQGKLGIRVKDMNSPRRKSFPGLQWYPIDEAARVQAHWVSYPTPKPIPITNVLGQVDDLSSPGYATFTWDGQEVTLHPVLDAPDSRTLFFIFRDKTSGKTTYGGGRFLYSSLPKAGTLELDFNKAYSPPCAFTDFATCPLPPPQNRLSVAIEAGEKAPAH
jgi:uncharacterized protein (DUF1684 family)